MKDKNSKFALIFTIIYNVAIVLGFVVGFVAIFFSIDLPDKLDKKTFIDYMEAKDCKINDMLVQEDYSGMDEYLITDEETCPYLISYATFNDKNVIREFFANGKKDVLQNNPNTKEKTSVSINIFSLQYYEYTTYGDYYKAIVYNDNSILYAFGNKESREKIINIFKDFNYKFEQDFQVRKVIWILSFILLFACIVNMWGTLKKTRNKGWISLIPFYNIGCLSKDILGSVWWALLLLVPIGNVVFMFMFYYNVGKVFNKSDFYCILNMFFPSIFWTLVAFDDSKYTKHEKKKKQVINRPVERIKIRHNRQKSIGKKTIEIIKWILTIIFILFSIFIILTYLSERLIGYLLIGILFIIYGMLLCPTITKSTIKYEKYTRFKPLIVIFLVILLIIIFGVLPF